MRIIIILAALAALGALFVAYARFVPASVTKYHQMPAFGAPGGEEYWEGFKSVRRITQDAETVLTAVQQMTEQKKRTVLFAGSVDEGMLTFVSRTPVFGFPDYTTVAVQGDLIVIYGRLRFSYYDGGVNKARVRKWLDALGPLTEPL